MLIYYSIAKKFVVAFLKNDRKRVIVEWEHKKDKVVLVDYMLFQ